MRNGIHVWLLIMWCIAAGCGRIGLSKEDKLVAASRNNDVTKISKLLASGANIDAQKKGMLEETPLVASATIDGTNAFFLLLKHGANVNAPAHDGITPLMEAVSLGDANLGRVTALIAAGANVNASDSHGNSVLSLAKAAAPAPDTIRALVAAGAKE